MSWRNFSDTNTMGLPGSFGSDRTNGDWMRMSGMSSEAGSCGTSSWRPSIEGLLPAGTRSRHNLSQRAIVPPQQLCRESADRSDGGSCFHYMRRLI